MYPASSRITEWMSSAPKPLKTCRFHFKSGTICPGWVMRPCHVLQQRNRKFFLWHRRRHSLEFTLLIKLTSNARKHGNELKQAITLATIPAPLSILCNESCWHSDLSQIGFALHSFLTEGISCKALGCLQESLDHKGWKSSQPSHCKVSALGWNTYKLNGQDELFGNVPRGHPPPFFFLAG